LPDNGLILAANIAVVNVPPTADKYVLEKTTPDIEETFPVAVYKLPPIPAPPVTTNAPVVVEEDAVELVTAKPESDTIPLDGFTTKVDIVERPSPEPFALFTAVIENDPFTTVGATATDEAAEGGTFCHVGSEAVPLEVKTCPLVALVANLPQVVVVVA
jgi:hypothetical protein